MINTIIFDLDGVILDSEKIHPISDKIVLARHNVSIPSGVKCFGKPLKDVLLEYYPDMDVNQIFNDKWETFFSMIDKIKVIQPTVDFIKKYYSVYRFALVTSTPAKYVPKILEMYGLNKYFSVIITLDDVTRPKPNPEPYIKGIKKLNVEKENAIVIEDSIVGIQAAKAAGLKCVGLIGTFPKEDISFADLVVEKITLGNLRPLLN